jgi:hypothetical protein
MPGSLRSRTAAATGGSSLRAIQMNSRSLASAFSRRFTSSASSPGTASTRARAVARGSLTSGGMAYAESTWIDTASSRPRAS